MRSNIVIWWFYCLEYILRTISTSTLAINDNILLCAVFLFLFVILSCALLFIYLFINNICGCCSPSRALCSRICLMRIICVCFFLFFFCLLQLTKALHHHITLISVDFCWHFFLLVYWFYCSIVVVWTLAVMWHTAMFCLLLWLRLRCLCLWMHINHTGKVHFIAVVA